VPKKSPDEGRQGVKAFPDPAERRWRPPPERVAARGTAFSMSNDPSHAAVRFAEGADLSRALAQGLNLPLSALRATMESLTLELADGTVRPQRLAGVLREVDRLGKNVRELLDFAARPTVRAQPCSLEEIVSAARVQLTPELRARVTAARCGRPGALVTDAPLLAGCLRRLLENALEAGTEQVLVVARREEHSASLAVFDDARGFGQDPQCIPFRTTKPNHLGLGLVLTQRDVELLRGRLEFLSTPGGGTCVRITIAADVSASANATENRS
jgi:signal transduction histidine kinase